MTAKRRLCVLFLGLSLGPLSAGSVLAQGNQAQPIKTIVEPLLREKIKAAGIPGLSCAVMVRDKLVYSEGFGFADVENDVPATTKTVYRLASISKPVTAVLLMQIVERGDLDLDTPVHQIVPEWPQKRWPVTCRQLLAHLGGVRHYLNEGESTKRYRDQLAGLSRFAADPLLHQPTTKYQYSTYGYNLLAAVVETHYAKTFGKVVQERLSSQCNAPSLQDDDQRRLIRWRAQGYRKRGGKLTNSGLMDSSYKLGGGGLCASAPDLARFGAALQLGKFVSPATLKQMWTEQFTKGGKGLNYGFGFRLGTAKGHRYAAHSGAQSRVSTMMSMLIDEQITVVIMCNLEGVRLSPLSLRIAVGVLEGMTPQPAKKAKQKTGGKR